MSARRLSRSTVFLRLRVDDADELWRVAMERLETEPSASRWLWWRIAQACHAALAPQKARDHAVVDRASH